MIHTQTHALQSATAKAWQKYCYRTKKKSFYRTATVSTEEVDVTVWVMY